jgi:hypothetical protein
MLRPVVCCIAVLAAACPAAAQAPEPIRLIIRPAAEPVPSLKIALLPDVKDRSPGNAATLYYRSFSPEWYFWKRKPNYSEILDQALAVPMSELKKPHPATDKPAADWTPASGRPSEFDWVVRSNQLHEVDLAVRREYCNWELIPRIRADGIRLLLPDIQSFRETGKLLAYRTRLEIADGHFDKAIHSLQTSYGLAHDVGQAPVLIASLVGVALAENSATRQLEELIQQPGSPNFYWALAALPRPFVDLTTALQAEKLLPYTELPELPTLETVRLSPDQLRQLTDHAVQMLLDIEELSGGAARGRAALVVFTAKAYPAAKRILIAAGRKREEVEATPALQVVLIQSWRQYQHLEDDLHKWMSLPYWQAKPHLKRTMEKIREARARMEAYPFIGYLPALQKVYDSTSRLDRRLAALRCVEALRLYAAAHDGMLPTTLSDITQVPVPIDPMTGHAFIYIADGDKATLVGPHPAGEEATSGNSLTYELTLQR